MAEFLDCRQVKADARVTLRDAQVSPAAFFALYLALTIVLDAGAYLLGGDAVSLEELALRPVGLFSLVLVMLISVILGAGTTLYCMAIREGERAEFLALFDGFSFAGRLILLSLLEYVYVMLWSMLFVIPGFIAMYRYRFAVMNLCENPQLSAGEALAMSKRQTMGYKGQLLRLDVSFLGWILLAYLPSVYDYLRVFLSVYEVALPAIPLEGLAYLAVSDGLLFTAGLCYLPQYKTAELAYFETAKRTSHVGAGVEPPSGGPDTLGGF